MNFSVTSKSQLLFLFHGGNKETELHLNSELWEKSPNSEFISHNSVFFLFQNCKKNIILKDIYF